MVFHRQYTPVNTYISTTSYDSGIEMLGGQSIETNNNISLDEQHIDESVAFHNFHTSVETSIETGIESTNQRQFRRNFVFEHSCLDQKILDDEFVEGLLQFSSHEEIAVAPIEEECLTSPTFSDGTMSDETFIPSPEGVVAYSSELNFNFVNFACDMRSDVCPDLVPLMPHTSTETNGKPQKMIQSFHSTVPTKPMQLVNDTSIYPNMPVVTMPMQSMHTSAHEIVPVVYPSVQEMESVPVVESFQIVLPSESQPEIKANKHLDYFNPSYFHPDSVDKAYRFFVKAVDYFSDKKCDGDRMFSPKQRAQEAMQLTIRCSASFEQAKPSRTVWNPKVRNRALRRKDRERYEQNARRRVWIRHKRSDETLDQDKEEEAVSLTKDGCNWESEVGELKQVITFGSGDDLGNLQVNFEKPMKEIDPLNRILSDKNLRKQLDDVVMRAWRRRGSRVSRKNFIYKIVKSPVVCPYRGCIFSVLGFRGEKVRMNHIEACHKRVNSLQCDICGMMLSRSDALVRHIKQQHSNDKKNSKKIASQSYNVSQLEKIKTGLPDEIPLDIFADPESFKQKRMNPKFALENIIKEKEEKLRYINAEQCAAASDYLNLKPVEKAAHTERTREACYRSLEEQRTMRQHIEHMKVELEEKRLYRASFEKYDFDLLYAKAIENSTHDK